MLVHFAPMCQVTTFKKETDVIRGEEIDIRPTSSSTAIPQTVIYLSWTDLSRLIGHTFLPLSHLLPLIILRA